MVKKSRNEDTEAVVVQQNQAKKTNLVLSINSFNTTRTSFRKISQRCRYQGKLGKSSSSLLQLTECSSQKFTIRALVCNRKKQTSQITETKPEKDPVWRARAPHHRCFSTYILGESCGLIQLRVTDRIFLSCFFPSPMSQRVGKKALITGAPAD